MLTTVVTAGLVALVIFGFIFMTGSNDKRRAIERGLQDLPDFDPVIIGIQNSMQSERALDPARRKLAIVQAPGRFEREWRFVVYGSDDVAGVELVKDGVSITKTQRGSQLVGAAIGGTLLGPAGLIVGGLSGAQEQRSQIEKLSIKILVNDLLAPVQEVVFLDHPNGGIPPQLALPVIQEAELWHSRVKLLVESE